MDVIKIICNCAASNTVKNICGVSTKTAYNARNTSEVICNYVANDTNNTSWTNIIACITISGDICDTNSANARTVIFKIICTSIITSKNSFTAASDNSSETSSAVVTTHC